MTARRDSKRWQESGLYTPQGNLDRPVDAEDWYVPHVELHSDRLYWSHSEGEFIKVRSGPGMLEQFVSLGDAPTERIVEYARCWGVLEICEHDLPVGHAHCTPLRSERARGEFWEPVESWRLLARASRAVLNIAARVQQGKVGKPEDWDILRGFEAIRRFPLLNPQGTKPQLAVGIRRERGALALALNWFIGVAGIRPLVVDRRGRWELKFVGYASIGGMLFPNIVMQLMTAVTGTEGLAICSHCGDPYRPSRRPNPNRRQYCLECSKTRIPQRDAARAYRQRHR